MTTQLAQLQTVQKGRILEGLPGQLRLGSRGRGNERERERQREGNSHSDEMVLQMVARQDGVHHCCINFVLELPKARRKDTTSLFPVFLTNHNFLFTP